MNKTKTAVKKMLKNDYDKACNAYVVELLRMWDWDAHYGYWVADEVGGVYAYGDFGRIDMELTHDNPNREVVERYARKL